MATKKRKSKAKLRLFAYVDLETLDGFLGDAIFCQSQLKIGEELHSPVCDTGFYCIKKMYDRFCSIYDYHVEKGDRPILTIYIHNAGFDLMRFKEQLKCVTIKYILSGTTVVKATLKDGDRTFFVNNSYAMLPMSLKKLGESFGTTKKTERDHNTNPDPENQQDIEYAINDVIVLREVIEKYSETLDLKEQILKVTAASMAMFMFKKIYKKEFRHHWQGLSELINKECEKFYRGGRIIIKDNYDLSIEHKVCSLDITSSYPASMINYHYPMAGKNPTVFEKNVIKTLNEKGRFLIEIDVIDYQSDLPILPVFEKTGVVYKIGSFETSLTDLEYKYLIKKHPDLNHTVKKIYYWDEKKCDKIFEPYVKKYYLLKQKGDSLNAVTPGSGDALRTVAKLLLNSLYGKFAQKYEQEQPIIIGENPEFFDDINGFKENRFDHRYFAIAALVTGASRVLLYEACDYYGAENIIYCDTDSIKVLNDVYLSKGKLPTENDELGGWKFEGIGKVRVHAPKVYSWINDNGELDIKAKGISFKVKMKINGVEYTNLDDAKVLIYNAIKLNDPVIIHYPPKPNSIKGFNKTGAMALSYFRTLTDRNNVAAMAYNEENNCFNYKKEKRIM